MSDEDARMLIKDGYSAAAVAMFFGPVGSPEYHEAMRKYGGDVSGKCPHCGELCFGTGDCNCRED